MLLFKLKQWFKYLCSEEMIFEYFIKKGSLKFIQIGGFDGYSFDNLYSLFKKTTPQGIIVEPINEYFLRLKHNTAIFTEIKLLNIAIHNTYSESIIYKIKNECEKDYPDWVQGCASFIKENLTKHHINEDCIEQEKVKCESINQMIKNNYFYRSLDFLQIDCEGYDGQILLDFNFNQAKPAVIKFEHVNLNPKEENLVRRKLKKLNYIIFKTGNNTIAIEIKILPKILF